MGSLSPIHWLIIIAVLLLIFARPGKLSGLMGDAAKGIRAFRDGMKDDHAETPPAQATPTLPPVQPEKDPIVR